MTNKESKKISRIVAQYHPIVQREQRAEQYAN